MRTMIVVALALILEAGSRLQADAPNLISDSQQKWVKVYQKQVNIPQPKDMLLNTDPEPDLEDGFVDLSKGNDLSDWTARGGKCQFEIKDGVITGTVVRGSPSTYLSTNRSDYRDFVFTAELKHEVDGNTGIMFRAAVKPGKSRYRDRLRSAM